MLTHEDRAVAVGMIEMRIHPEGPVYGRPVSGSGRGTEAVIIVGIEVLQ